MVVDVGLLTVGQRARANTSFAHGREDGVQLIDDGYKVGGCFVGRLWRTVAVGAGGSEGK